MSKIILIFIIALVVYWVIRSYGRRLPKDNTPHQVKNGEDMVRCSECGVHMPRSESILAADKFYCSEQHRRGG
ncbi:MAG: preprotein translocase subunit YajC [Burkholderiales bacterium]|nr:preprotein translocase subunit YajC [Burkholderiales bacterium]